MNLEQIKLKYKEIEEKNKLKQQEKEELLKIVAQDETDIKIKQIKIAEIDESILFEKDEMTKLINAIEILER